MELKLPILPNGKEFIAGENKHFRKVCGTVIAYTSDDMRQYAEQAVAPLLAEIEKLEGFIEELCRARDED